jgi:hypothetical protein
MREIMSCLPIHHTRTWLGICTGGIIVEIPIWGQALSRISSTLEKELLSERRNYGFEREHAWKHGP